jgi:hypothetical protein
MEATQQLPKQQYRERLQCQQPKTKSLRVSPVAVLNAACWDVLRCVSEFLRQRDVVALSCVSRALRVHGLPKLRFFKCLTILSGIDCNSVADCCKSSKHGLFVRSRGSTASAYGLFIRILTETLNHLDRREKRSRSHYRIFAAQGRGLLSMGEAGSPFQHRLLLSARLTDITDRLPGAVDLDATRLRIAEMASTPPPHATEMRVYCQRLHRSLSLHRRIQRQRTVYALVD